MGNEMVFGYTLSKKSREEYLSKRSDLLTKLSNLEHELDGSSQDLADAEAKSFETLTQAVQQFPESAEEFLNIVNLTSRIRTDDFFDLVYKKIDLTFDIKRLDAFTFPAAVENCPSCNIKSVHERSPHDIPYNISNFFRGSPAKYECALCSIKYDKNTDGKLLKR